jgi:hypothetical protein
MVSEIYARGFAPSRIREGSTRAEERRVGGSAAGAAVGMAEEEALARAELALYDRLQPLSLSNNSRLEASRAENSLTSKS